MSARHLEPEKCNPSEILFKPTRPARLRKDYTLFGNETMFLVAVYYPADGEFRICVPMSDFIDGKFDDKGVKLLLDIGGESGQRILQLTVEING